MRTGILFFFHCKSNTGYAIETLEEIFRLAAETSYTSNGIYFAYPDIKNGLSNAFPANFTNVIKFDPNTKDISQLHDIYHFIEEKKIKVAVGFDQGPYKKIYKFFKDAGVKKVISYWGAPMGDPCNIVKLTIKKLLLMIAPWPQPDLYIFESKAMANSALSGRGIPPQKVQIVRLGVDTDKFRPAISNKEKQYVYSQFNIPEHRKIIFYSGHMEKRKGINVIIKAAIDIIERHGKDVHFLLLGNQPNEEKPYMQMLEGTTTHKHVTFGGYRKDIAEIHRGCYLGVIASTGWDSFTMSSIEMMSSGLPLLVSSLQGLKETVVNGKTGFLFPPGDSSALASSLLALLEGSDEKKDMLALQARKRACRKFSKNRQVTQLSYLFRHID